MPLGNSLIILIAERVDPSTDVVTYAVQGRRLSGSVTLYPRYSNNTEATPSRIVIESGNRPREGAREDIFTINGIQIDFTRSLDLKGNHIEKCRSLLRRPGFYGWDIDYPTPPAELF